MGLYKDTVQNIITGSYMLPNADNKRKLNVSKEKVQGKIKKKKKFSIKKHSIPRFWTRGFKS
jgi:hypothetical protein